jgi:hypothetical protein
VSRELGARSRTEFSAANAVRTLFDLRFDANASGVASTMS